LDSNVCIAVLRGRPASVSERLKRAFIAPYEILSFDVPTASIYGRLAAEMDRAGNPIGALDLQIAATAIRHGLVLVTHDAAFGGIMALRTEDWEKTPPPSV
jgi:tRNA(fMet)-specific endonuclease VapC